MFMFFRHNFGKGVNP